MSAFAPLSQNDWPSADGKHDDFSIGGTVAACDAIVRQGFLRKVFGLVAAQLIATSLLCAVFMYEANVRHFVLTTPSMLFVSFLTSLGFLFAAQIHKDRHPSNLYYLAGFTLSMAWSVGVVCARFQERGLGLVVLEAVALTASVTAGLTLYTLKSKADFSYMGAGLGSALWVLILGSFIAPFTGMAAMHFALAVGGAAVFSLYIVFDVFMISKRLSPDEYVPAAINLYLDILNLFLNILRILAATRGND